jgi:hypothetical protein
MMAEIINFNRSVPTNFVNGVSRQLSDTPIRLAAFGMTISTSETDVVLEATVGVSVTLGIPDILFSVIRGTQVIGTTRSSTVAADEIAITAEIVNDVTLNQATVIGPIVYSGTAIQM